MLTLSSMIIIFQDSPYSPMRYQNETNLNENIPNDDQLSTSNVTDYSKQGEDVHNPRDSADFSELYYKYKNSAVNQANDTLSYLISNLWDSNYKGFNDSDATTAQKNTLDNVLMLINLLDFNSITPNSQYVTYAEEIFNFLYNYLWDNQSNLFLSYSDYDGTNPSPQLNSSDNALAIIALLKLYEATSNQTYLNIANSTYSASITTFYDTTNGGYFTSNLTGDTNKRTYDNLLVSLALTEISRAGFLSGPIQAEALRQAEAILNLLITKFLNGSYGFFTSGDANWTNPDAVKNVLVNALAITTLLSVYDLNFNETYLDIAVSTASFIDTAFWDSTGTYRGYNFTVNWDGTAPINSTKYLEANVMLLNSYLALFEKTHNSTHYLNAIKITHFLDTSLWASSVNAFNYSVDFNFASSNSSLKSTAANALAIQALLAFRYPKPYLTRANTTMTYLTNYMLTDNLFDGFIMYDWSSLDSQVLYTFPSLITLDDLFTVTQPVEANLYAIYTLLELADETLLTEYINIANETMYSLNETAFSNAFIENITSGVYSTEVNAWGLLSLLKLYEKTNDSALLDIANQTWYFIRDNLYDSNNYGYNTTTSEDSKDLIANCLMIWANLEIIDTNYSIFTNILTNISDQVNQTLNLLYQNMWDNSSFGFFNNATADWIPSTTGETSKQSFENGIMIQTLLKYISLYPEPVNQTQYSNRINQTIEFLLTYLWDNEVGGFYIGCNETGSVQNTDKYAVGNSWAAVTFLELFEATGNYTYYLIAEETSNFLNTYLWDFEYGGFHHYCSKDGVPYALGTLDVETGKKLLSFKFIESQISSIFSLNRLSKVKESLPFSLIVDIEFQPTLTDRGALNLQVSLKLIDINGDPVNQANVTVSMSGLYSTISEENFYGFASKDYLDSNFNNFSIDLDISAFLGDFHLTLMAFNSSMAVTWISISTERTFGTYLSRAFALLTSLHLFVWDDTNGGYIPAALIGANDTKNTFDNWMAILAISEYYNATGLNLFYNFTTSDLEQILTGYINRTFNFLNNNLAYNPVNETSMAFFTGSNADGSVVSSEILCRDTALAVISLLEYYRITNNSIYLDLANRTWEFLNDTFWDSANFGYIHANGTSGSETKYSIDNIWAISANLAIYNTPEINQTIRNSAFNMTNLTITLLIQNIWDNVSLGYFSSFAGSTWVPYNTSTNCKTAEVNSLAIQMLLDYAGTLNGSKRAEYINYANETFRFMDQTLKDKQFLGYYTSTNNNGTIFNTNKTLNENSLMILSLLDLYRANNYNYTYYQLAEESLFFISRYFINPLFTIYHNVSSRYGAINFNPTNYVPIEGYSNFIFLRSLTQADLERQALNYPLVLDDITVESPELGEIQNVINMTVKVYDSDGNPVENASVIGMIYGKYEVFTFTQLKNNTYYCMVNVSNIAGELEINLLAFKDGYSAGTKDHLFSQIFPTYIQKSYETLIALLVQLWDDSKNILYNDEIYYQYGSSGNFMAIEAMLDFMEIGGDILWSFDWFANRTLLSYSQLIGQYLDDFLNSSIIQADSQNVSGYVTKTAFGLPINESDCATNALAIISILDLYNKTNNPFYLELANRTWLYFNATFWDPINLGYKNSNSNSTSKFLYDNCMAISANLRINETLGINPTIRSQALTLANLTFVKMNQSLWDNDDGTYFTRAATDWSNPHNRSTIANALMILTLLDLYNSNPNQTDYLNRANITAELFLNNFYNSTTSSYYQFLKDNFSAPVSLAELDVFLIDQAWAILALAEIYAVTGNKTYYYRAEDVMNFVNSHLANHFNSFLNTDFNDINGYWDLSSNLGLVFGKPTNYYIGSLEPSALTIQAMLKLFIVANSTLPLLNVSVQVLPASDPPNGDFCNITIAIYNEMGTKIQADLNITLSGWTRSVDVSLQEISKNLQYEYNSNTQEYQLNNINISGLEDIYFTVYAKNLSYATFWKEYYIHRTESGISAMWGVGGDYVPTEDYWQYTIGEDLIIVEAFYTDFSTFQGIPGAALNFTVQYPNGTIWFSELVTTNTTGWGQLIFGPVPNIALLFGVYKVTVYATHVNRSVTPKTWYAPTTDFININIDYGVSIPFFNTLEAIVAQGDILQCNVTIKHRMLANLSVDILIYSDGVIIPSNITKNLTTGLNNFIIDVNLDERTPIGLKFIYINVSFEDRVIRDSYFWFTLVSAAVIRNYYAPTWIAEDDVRYAAIEFEHRKMFETSNISIKIDCPALEENPTIQILQPLAWQEYYFPLIVKTDIPYGTYSGEIIVERVNYTLEYDDNPLTFQIEVRPPTDVSDIQVPSDLVQQQQSMISVTIQNNKITPSTIKIIGSGEGFTDFEEIYTITPGQTEIINIQLSYFVSPWDSGLRELTLEIYYLNESSQYTLISSNTHQINIASSINNILLGYFLPTTLIAVVVVWILWRRDKKRRERKKLK